MPDAETPNLMSSAGQMTEMVDPYEFGKGCGAHVYCARLCDAMNTSGFGASDEAIARGEGLRMPRCYLPRNHEGPHMLDPVMWEPPEPPPSPTDLLRRVAEEVIALDARGVLHEDRSNALHDLLVPMAKRALDA